MRDNNGFKEKELNNKLEKVNKTLADCESLKSEWEARIEEVKGLQVTYETLIRLLKNELKIDD